MSISQLVPLKEAEMVLLEELQSESKAAKTGDLVKRAMKRFPQLTKLELGRRTPSGTLWWPGRFRFDLDRLKKKGEVGIPTKGYREITALGVQRLNGSNLSATKQVHKLSKPERKALDLAVEYTEAMKTGKIPGIVIMKGNELTIKVGGKINQTKVIVAK